MQAADGLALQRPPEAGVCSGPEGWRSLAGWSLDLTGLPALTGCGALTGWLAGGLTGSLTAGSLAAALLALAGPRWPSSIVAGSWARDPVTLRQAV